MAFAGMFQIGSIVPSPDYRAACTSFVCQITADPVCS
jgi:hypothetical protein